MAANALRKAFAAMAAPTRRARGVSLLDTSYDRIAMATRYYISLPDPAKARGAGEFGFRSQGADGLAGELQDALRSDALFERWRAAQDDPDGVDTALGATDPNASVSGEQNDLHVDLIAVTSIPGTVFKHRLRLLAGSAWELRDVSAA